LLITDYYDQKKDKFKISVLWFVIGVFIGPFGVIAAYTSRQSKGEVSKKNKIISVWLGFLAFIIWFGYFFLF
jgi:predicted small integral membrane protein